MNNPMIPRIRERLKATGKNEYEVAIAAGFDRIYLYEFLEGRKASIRLSNVPRLAEQLDCDPRYLTGEISTPWPEDDGDSEAKSPAHDMIAVEGIITRDAWFSNAFQSPTRILVAPDARYPAQDQHAFLVSGDTWKNVGIFNTSVVVAVPMAPREGDLVVTKIQRKNGEAQIVIAQQTGGELVIEDAPRKGETVHAIGVIVSETRTF